jgi:hypothetical protein
VRVGPQKRAACDGCTEFDVAQAVHDDVDAFARRGTAGLVADADLGIGTGRSLQHLRVGRAKTHKPEGRDRSAGVRVVHYVATLHIFGRH